MNWSRYTLLFNKKGRYFIYNSLTNSLAELSKDVYLVVKNGLDTNSKDKISKDIYDKLCSMKAIVDNDDDEINKIKYVTQMRRQYDKRLILTINPTLACNFNCPYCFEVSHPNSYMSDKIEDDIISFVKSKNSLNAIDVTWFGGEPLLAFKRVKSLTNRLLPLGHQYSASMITNGYLLSDSIIDELPKLKIKFLQITIDGLQELHDSRRCLKNGSPTFERIISNIDNLQETHPEIKVSIRMNVDESNEEDFVKLYHFISSKHYPNAHLSLAFVHDNTNNRFCQYVCDRKQQADFVKHIYKQYSIGRDYIYPRPNRSECAVRNKNELVIGPKGEVYKCWNDVGDKNKIIGYINGESTNRKLLLRYLIGADPFEDSKCQSCILLPICSGGCPLSRIQNKFDGKQINVCPLMKENLEDFLSLHATRKESINYRHLQQ